MTATSVLTHRIEWGETDTAAIVYFPNYFRWFDRATHELLRAIGFPVTENLARGFATPLIECHARFTRPLRYDDVITITSRVAEVRSRAFRVEHSITRGDEPIGDGYDVRMWVAVASHQPQTISPELLPPGLRAALLAE
jgi:YbgC/YbaW family acyl-CoA thioester hydrolase